MIRTVKQISRAVYEPIFYIFGGGCIYYIIELLYRGRSHWSMALTGGVCFALISLLMRTMPRQTPMIWRMAACAVSITSIELIVGIIANIQLKLHIWDYSRVPLNFMGQISVLFTVLWFFLSGVGIFLDNAIRRFLFGKPTDHYTTF